MTVEELYERIGGNYQEALGRLQSDALISMFVTKFLDDQSCPNLIAAWKAGDEKAAFEAAHVAKGVCGNLSLGKLADVASEITEALRPGNDALRAQTDVDALIAQLEELYATTIAAIKELAGTA